MHKPPSSERNRRRLVRHLLWGLVLLLLLYLGYSAWQTYRHLSALRTHLTALRASLGSPSVAGSHLVRLQDDMAALRRDLWLPLTLAPHLGWLPGMGPTVQATPKLFTSAERLLAAGILTWQVLEAPVSTALKDTGDMERAAAMLLNQVRARAADLADASALVREASDLLNSVEAKRLIPQLSGRIALIQSLTPLLNAAFEGLPLLPRLLDRRSESTYLLLAQNNDELRPTGGFISSIGVITVSRGIPHWVSFKDSYAVEDWKQAHPDPPEPLRKYMGLDLWVTRDGNWWPDFPTSAQAVAELYTLNQGQQVDGVIAVDMIAAARLVDALAPLELASGQRVERGRILEAFRESWSLPPGSLVTQGVFITVTKPFTAIEIELSYSNKEGQAWFDAVEIMDLHRPGVNLVNNSSFEEDSDQDGLPDGWVVSGFAETDRLVTDYAYTGRQSLLIVGNPQEHKTIRQRVAVSGEAGSSFLISAQSRSEDTDTKGGTYALTLSFLNAEGKAQGFVAGFPPLSHDWATAGTDDVLNEWWRHRKDFMNQTLSAALNKLLSNSEEIRWGELFVTIRNLLDERHIQIYLKDPVWQSLIQRYGWSGALVETDGDYLAVVDSNVGYNKVTASVEQSMAYAVTATDGRLRAKLTIRYHNRSTQRDDRCDKFRQYVPTYDALTQGCYWDYVRVYVPLGAELLAGTGGDEPITTTVELSRTCFATYFMLRPGEERELSLEYALPERLLHGGTYRLYVQKQAGTGAIPLTITLTASGKPVPRESNAALSEQTVHRLLWKTDLLIDRYVVAELQP